MALPRVVQLDRVECCCWPLSLGWGYGLGCVRDSRSEAVNDYERSLFFRWFKFQAEARQDRTWWKLALVWLSYGVFFAGVVVMVAFVVLAIGTDPRYNKGPSDTGVHGAGGQSWASLYSLSPSLLLPTHGTGAGSLGAGEVNHGCGFSLAVGELDPQTLAVLRLRALRLSPGWWACQRPSGSVRWRWGPVVVQAFRLPPDQAHASIPQVNLAGSRPLACPAGGPARCRTR